MADSARMQALAQRIQAAQQRGDMREVQRLADSVGRSGSALAQRANASGERRRKSAATKCGAEPQEPPRPADRQALSYGDVQAAGTKASGFDNEQYRILRERVAPFVLSQGKNSVPFVYTKNELAALQSRLDALEPYADLMKNY
jgi:hypothetical protein